MHRHDLAGRANTLLRERGEDPWTSAVTPRRLAGVVGLLRARTISMPIAKEVLAEVAATGGDPAEIVESRGLAQIGDEDALLAAVRAAPGVRAHIVWGRGGGGIGSVGRFVRIALSQCGRRCRSNQQRTN